MKKNSALVATCLLVGLLTACGGGNGNYVAESMPNVAGTDVPTAVTSSAAAVVTFAKDQQAKTSDVTDPLVLGNAMLAVDDTAEPAPV